MKWKKFTIRTTTQAEDFVSSMLADLGIEGVLIEDNVPLSAADKEKMFIDILPELPPDEGVAFISFFLDAESGHEEMLGKVREEFKELSRYIETGTGDITSEETEDIDWINNWKQFFKSFVVEDILIKPTWEQMPENQNYKHVIEIDPGTSFGTGQHETTQLCIRQLHKYMKPEDNVLDVGCGSGILSLACMKMGANSITGTDVDEACIRDTCDNMRINHIPERDYRFYHGNLIDDSTFRNVVGDGYDIVVANILADIVIPLTPVISNMINKEGIYITSGIIDFKEEEVKKTIAASGFEILEVNHQGEWVSITAKR